MIAQETHVPPLLRTKLFHAPLQPKADPDQAAQWPGAKAGSVQGILRAKLRTIVMAWGVKFRVRYGSNNLAAVAIIGRVVFCMPS